ncbi:RNHCP domain-containing protein [Candidatus Parcubacteria bacterium]|nr:RNHCP domain-containing protein [Candidatus Parcubacteria bacterium]
MKNFTRTIENFVCENCNAKVEGNGYTNHCPNCLWSKHVDVNPGDRLAECGGIMEPIGIENKSDVFFVVQKCQKCGHLRRNKLNKGDNFDEAIKLFNRN